jgi:ammonia channel protein AmtB
MKSLKLLTLHCSNIRWSIWVQVEGVLATMVYSGMTFIILKVIDLVIGIRVI